jgi:protein SCO1
MTRILLLAMLLALLGPGRPAGAVANDLSLYSYQQRLGAHLPLDAPLTDESGQARTLGDMIGGRPTILALGYFRCPNLCGVVRDDMFSALSRANIVAGHDYSLVVMSIDTSEGPADAAQAKRDDLSRYGAPGATENWRFVTGRPPELDAIERGVGFRAEFDPRLKQFIHPAGLVFLTPAGVVSGYLLGVGYQPSDIEQALAVAGRGRIADAVSPVLLICFHFDPTTGRYTLAIWKLVQLGCAFTVVVLGGTIFLALRRERRH